MAQTCEICHKTPRVGRNVSHSNIKTSRTWHANLQRVRARVGNRVQRITACTRCIRSGRVVKVA